jgi:hypothetical protein
VKHRPTVHALVGPRALANDVAIAYSFHHSDVASRTDLLDPSGRFDIREIGYDRTFAGEIVTNLQDKGHELVQFGRGFLSLAAPSATRTRPPAPWPPNRPVAASTPWPVDFPRSAHSINAALQHYHLAREVQLSLYRSRTSRPT